MAASKTQSSSHASSSSHAGSVVAAFGLDSFSPFIWDDQNATSVDFLLDVTINCKDLQIIVQVMPPLMKVSCPLTAVK